MTAPCGSPRASSERAGLRRRPALCRQPQPRPRPPCQPPRPPPASRRRKRRPPNRPPPKQRQRPNSNALNFIQIKSKDAPPQARLFSVREGRTIRRCPDGHSIHRQSKQTGGLTASAIIPLRGRNAVFHFKNQAARLNLSAIAQEGRDIEIFLIGILGLEFRLGRRRLNRLLDGHRRRMLRSSVASVDCRHLCRAL